MNNSLNILKLLICIGVAAWDVATTYNGIHAATNSNMIAIVLMLFVNGALALTFYPLKENELADSLAKIFWVIALITDVVTAYHGNIQFVDVKEFGPLQYFIVGTLAILTCLGTIGVSYVLFILNKTSTR